MGSSVVMGIWAHHSPDRPIFGAKYVRILFPRERKKKPGKRIHIPGSAAGRGKIDCWLDLLPFIGIPS